MSTYGNMDEQYYQLQIFHQRLTAFNDHLRSSIAEMEARHSVVSPHWQDENRRRYDSIWAPFEETMKRYISLEGPAYVHFLSDKIVETREYLGNG